MIETHPDFQDRIEDINQEDANTLQDMVQTYREMEEEKYPNQPPSEIFTRAQHRIFTMFDVISIKHRRQP
tara:strand:+ start:1046 stop:1255 length:210 start_codon:yes stop_codon:yes gene_type:complete